MKWSATTVALLLAIAPTLAIAQSHESGKNGAIKPRNVTLQGCVVPGIDSKTAALSSVTEIAEPGQSVMPAEAHGRRIVFWLTPDDEIVKYSGSKVEVRGTTTAIEESEIALKSGHQKTGGLVVEFDVPGKNVKVPNDAIGQSVGTAGRTTKGKDLPAFLIRVNVQSVKPVDACK
jgi:hypothetical protein